MKLVIPMAHAEHHGHHIVPLKLLWTVFGGLVLLTIATVLTARFVDLGPFNLPLALVIAVGKASLVVAFFMALKWDNRVNLLVFVLGCLFVVVFLSFTLFDTAYRGDIGNVGSETISDMERVDEALQHREDVLQGIGTDTESEAEAPPAESH